MPTQSASGRGKVAGFVDADGCPLKVGQSTFIPWRWGLVSGHKAAKTCLLSRGVRMSDPETGKALPRFHEIAFET